MKNRKNGLKAGLVASRLSSGNDQRLMFLDDLCAAGVLMTEKAVILKILPRTNWQTKFADLVLFGRRDGVFFGVSDSVHLANVHQALEGIFALYGFSFPAKSAERFIWNMKSQKLFNQLTSLSVDHLRA